MNDLTCIHHNADYENVGFWPLPYRSLPHISGGTAGFPVNVAISLSQPNRLQAGLTSFPDQAPNEIQ